MAAGGDFFPVILSPVLSCSAVLQAAHLREEMCSDFFPGGMPSGFLPLTPTEAVLISIVLHFCLLWKTVFKCRVPGKKKKENHCHG